MSQRLFLRLDGGPLEPAEFRVVDTSDDLGAAVSRRIDVCCPRCSTVTTIDAEIHTVRRDGAVTPVWSCGSVECSYVEWLQLEVP